MTDEVMQVIESLIGQTIEGISYDPTDDIIVIMTDQATITFEIENDALEMYVSSEVKQ